MTVAAARDNMRAADRGVIVMYMYIHSGGVKTRTKVSRRSWGFNELEAGRSGGGCGTLMG